MRRITRSLVVLATTAVMGLIAAALPLVAHGQQRRPGSLACHHAARSGSPGPGASVVQRSTRRSSGARPLRGDDVALRGVQPDGRSTSSAAFRGRPARTQDVREVEPDPGPLVQRIRALRERDRLARERLGLGEQPARPRAPSPGHRARAAARSCRRPARSSPPCSTSARPRPRAEQEEHLGEIGGACREGAPVAHLLVVAAELPQAAARRRRGSPASSSTSARDRLAVGRRQGVLPRSRYGACARSTSSRASAKRPLIASRPARNTRTLASPTPSSASPRAAVAAAARVSDRSRPVVQRGRQLARHAAVGKRARR